MSGALQFRSAAGDDVIVAEGAAGLVIGTAHENVALSPGEVAMLLPALLRFAETGRLDAPKSETLEIGVCPRCYGTTVGKGPNGLCDTCRADLDEEGR